MPHLQQLGFWIGPICDSNSEPCLHQALRKVVFETRQWMLNL